jgi:hypothetical protein
MEFDLDGLLANESDLEDLARLVYLIEDGWHAWVSPDPGDDRLADYLARHPLHQDLLTKSYAAALAYPAGGPSAEPVRVKRSPALEGAAERTFDLRTAYEFASQPLTILVENRLNDGKFLRHMLGPVDTDLVTAMVRARAPMVFENGGGKAEILNQLRDRIITAATRPVPERLVVLVDSDARFPGHRTSETADILAAGQALGAPIVVLQKRSIENYIPDRVLHDYARQYPDIEAAARFITGLRPDQRDHYPIKKGLKRDPADPSKTLGSDQEEALYHGVVFPDQPVAKLPRVAEYFLRLWESACHAADLRARQCWDELDTIAATLRKEL